MSFRVCYVLKGRQSSVDGDHLSTARGWLGFCEWVESLDDAGESLLRLCDDGEGYPPDALQTEVEAALSEDGPQDAQHVGRTLLEALKARPEGTVGVLVVQ